MGREVKRVPKDFEAPINEVWFGYTLPSIPCPLCEGTGKRRHDPEDYCDTCGGEGTAFPRVEVPAGDAYQMWETTSEGSPISPAFDTPEQLARWLADSGASACGGMTASYDQWLRMIEVGSAPTMIMQVRPGEAPVIESGVEFCSRE